MAHHSHYRRVVVAMQEGPAPAPALRIAAELAHLLDLELEGVFVENAALLHLASFPFAREFRLPGRTWEALDSRRMVADFRLAAERAERLLAAAAAGLGVASAFSVLRADTPDAPPFDARPDDILVISEPEAERPDWPLGRPGTAAGANACVLLAPARATIRHGPIAVAERPGAGLALGIAIARGAGEDLLLLAPAGGTTPRLAIEPGFSTSRVRRRVIRNLAPEELARAASREHARLLVLEVSREEDIRARPRLARFVQRTGMPVLLLCEPETPSRE